MTDENERMLMSSETFTAITSTEQLERAAQQLALREPRFAHVLELIEALALRARPDGFPALREAILSQQVSVAAAEAISRRLHEAGLDQPQAITLASAEALRACGLSRQKARYLKALVEAEIDYDALRHAPDEEVIARLTQVTGVGRWTAEIYAMFALGRQDVFAAGDLALQESARLLFELPQRPTEARLRRFAQAWSPWRAVAARLLWAYYHTTKP